MALEEYEFVTIKASIKDEVLVAQLTELSSPSFTIGSRITFIISPSAALCKILADSAEWIDLEID